MYVGWTDERKELVFKLWNEGLTGTQIACRVGGISRNAVLGLVHRKGLMGRRNQGDEQRQVNRIRHNAKARQEDKARQRYQMRHQAAPKKPKPVSAVKQLLRDLPIEPLPPVDPMKPTVCHNKLEHHHCRAPVGDHFHPDEPYYCGRQRMEGVSYCEHHARRYFAPPSIAKPYINESSRAVRRLIKAEAFKHALVKEFTEA